MDVYEPRVRHRGFFLHSDTTGDHDTGEMENPEGFIVRVRIGRARATLRQLSSIRSESGGRSRTFSRLSLEDEAPPQIRSGSVTGSRQRAHLPR